MLRDPTTGPDLRTTPGDDLARAMTSVVQDALAAHRRAGNAVVVWDRDEDRVALVPPEPIGSTGPAAAATARD